MSKWIVFQDGYENALRGYYGVEPDGLPRVVSVHATKKEATEACEKLQTEARASAYLDWYERGNPGVLMPTYSVTRK